MMMMSKEYEQETASALAPPDADHKDDQQSKSGIDCNQSVATNIKPRKPPGKAEKDRVFVAALGDKTALKDLPVVNTYMGEIILDCDGVTNLAASMILAKNLEARLATGLDFSSGQYGMYDALRIMSKKLLNKSYDFQMKLDNMNVGKLLGSGSYGQVWSAVLNGDPYALNLKQINPNKVRTANIYKERDLLLYLKNPRVCGIFGAWYEGHCFFLLEQCVGKLICLRYMIMV